MTFKLLRRKYAALKAGVDNTNYIKDIVVKENEKKKLKEELDKKYDYQNKKVVPSDAKVPEEEKEKVIHEFKNFFKL